MTQKPVLVVYATRQGHTRKVAQQVTDALRARGMKFRLYDAAEANSSVDVSEFGAAILAASVHGGRHEKEMVKFVLSHRDELEALPTSFLSVSLTEANAEREQSPPAVRKEASRVAKAQMDEFFEQTEWRPACALPVAGALMYSKYNLLVRWLMKRIAKANNASTDTTRDHVYTDWGVLELFVDDFVHPLPGYHQPGV